MVNSDYDKDAIYPENDEDGGSLVVRYLKTLCAWYDAATRIFEHIPKGVSLRVAHVRVNAVKSGITQSTTGDFITRYLETLTTPEHCARALAFFCSVGLTKLAKQGNVVKGPSDLPPFMPTSERTAQNFAKKATVHAEAALMGLMCLKRSGNTAYDTEGFENILKAKPTVIGVSKKCCRTCWILSQLLDADDAEADPSGKASVYLPGTHAMIYPWAPPEGIPLPILVQLRERLFSIFVRITCTHDTGLGSNQASPTLSQAPEPAVMVEPDEWAFETMIRVLCMRARSI
ncbi:hypothetical protein EXIGLDRAFT_771468 [Exidia glandulosa HHB12029]|uniref:Uncharacterized protein n=1 Tax=Exidia glandulosa HHB12029 TaxID=1314781 RepID=A0A165FYQ3_EXIGL|nr:hypothetical protein EXIGLDRAFT_771468 [Exidia glandulosa HHB12029]